jgi:hypothetical protein
LPGVRTGDSGTERHGVWAVIGVIKRHAVVRHVWPSDIRGARIRADCGMSVRSQWFPRWPAGVRSGIRLRSSLGIPGRSRDAPFAVRLPARHRSLRTHGHDDDVRAVQGEVVPSSADQTYVIASRWTRSQESAPIPAH